MEDGKLGKGLASFHFVRLTPFSLLSFARLPIHRFACVRRSLFASEHERNTYLTNLINGTREILMTQKGLGEHANYHEFCRLLGRLKTNYQLSELVGVENYSDWIQRGKCAQFSRPKILPSPFS